MNASGSKIKYIVLITGFGLLLVLPFTAFRSGPKEDHSLLQTDSTINPYAAPKDEAAAYIQKASENYFYREFDQGAENYKKAIAVFESRKDYPKIAHTYHSLGDLYLWAQEPVEAEASYVKAANYHIQAKDPLGQATDLMEIGEIYRKSDRFDQAEQWYQKSLMALEGTGTNRVFGSVQEKRGHNYWENNRIPQAITAFSSAHQIYSDLHYQLGIKHIDAVLNRLKNGKASHNHSVSEEGFRSDYRAH